MSEQTGLQQRSILNQDRLQWPSWQAWILPGLLFVEAFFLGSTFNTLTTTLAVFVAAVLVVIMVTQFLPSTPTDALEIRGARRPVGGNKTGSQTFAEGNQFARRFVFWRSLSIVPVVLVVAVIGVTWRVGYHVAGNLNFVAMIVDSVAHSAFWISLVLWMFYPRRGHPAMLGCGLILVLATVTAGGVSHSINGQLVAASATVIGIALGGKHILGRWQSHRDAHWNERHDRGRAGRFRNRWARADRQRLPPSTVTGSHEAGRSPLFFSVLALSVLLMSTTALGHLASVAVPGLQFELFDRLSQSLEAVTANSIIGGSRYVRGSRLGSVRRHMLGEPGEPALRAFASAPPGYLRGTVFDTYRNGSWSAASEHSYSLSAEVSELQPRTIESEALATTELQGPSSAPLQRVTLRDNPGGSTIGTIEVHNVPLKGQLVFSSMSTDWIEAVNFGVELSHQGMVIKGVDTQEPYVLGISTPMPRESLRGLRRNLMLQLTRSLREKVQPITRRVCEGRLTPRAKARAIEEYFQANYNYSLRGVTTPNDVDPVVHFLQTQHPAHCEFFASAAALMLRSVGVPTRYVTGYVVMEKSEEYKYWLARNRDAHAWVEAYDDINEQWFPVEATVGRTYRTLQSLAQQGTLAGGSDNGLVDSEDDISIISRTLGWLFSFRATDSLTFLFRIAQLPLFCLLIALLWLRHRQRLRLGGDPMEYQSRQMLQRVDRKLRKHALVRAPQETLHQFADRVQLSAANQPESAAFLTRSAAWYRSFAAARYQGLMPAPMPTDG
ncbi:DUF3488 and transglutaminase-like domain-containing protein [Stieleria sp. TO1_6]|uniref:transglutaminase-like domain-containing protein n=1 Tax=Stieleria tagensis TaxID=2956795 RepID=UPI00209B0EC7|nr:transglutaminase-like domain-containing protein [Stieleria tagensis]MCO8120272.1 DUF3488 and transglutaminase-like domain-containing protein [Stieleria tagensis]